MATNEKKEKDILRAVWSIYAELRGTIAPSIYKDYALIILFIKYISDVCKEHGESNQESLDKDSYPMSPLIKEDIFIVPTSASFDSLYDKRKEIGIETNIENSLKAIEAANISKLDGLFSGFSFNTNLLGSQEEADESLRFILEGFAKNDLNLRPSRIGDIRVIANVFNYLLTTTMSDLGFHYNTPELSTLIVKLVKPQNGDHIADPVCGSASLLLTCSNEIKRQPIGLDESSLYGQEVYANILSLAKLNLLLHDVKNYRLELGDSIRHPKFIDRKNKLTKFDVVVSVPPFGLSNWWREMEGSDLYGRFDRGIPPKSNSDYAYILHMIETLKPKTGRMAVVMPHGVLFRKGTEGNIRKALVKENLLDAVIGLPKKQFVGLVVSTVILIFKKEKKDKNVLFIDTADFVSGKTPDQLREPDIKKVLSTYKARETQENYSHLSSLEEIKKNNYDLSLARYIKVANLDEEIDIVALKRQRKDLVNEIFQLGDEIDRTIKKIS